MSDEWETYCLTWARHYWEMHLNGSIQPDTEARSWLWLLVAAGAPL